MNIDFDFNDKDFLGGLDKALKAGVDGIKAGVFIAAEQLREDSTDIVPFDKGFSGGLASTANTSRPKEVPSGIESEVSYNKAYAVKMHEDMSLNISQANTSPGQRRQQKYLEKPMREKAKDYGKIMAEHFSKAL